MLILTKKTPAVDFSMLFKLLLRLTLRVAEWLFSPYLCPLHWPYIGKSMFAPNPNVACMHRLLHEFLKMLPQDNTLKKNWLVLRRLIYKLNDFGASTFKKLCAEIVPFSTFNFRPKHVTLDVNCNWSSYILHPSRVSTRRQFYASRINIPTICSTGSRLHALLLRREHLFASTEIFSRY